jgi:hypothetical protein
MPTGSSPGEDIVKAILDNIGPIVVITIIILGAIGRAMKGSAGPPSGMPRPVPPPMAPPTTIPRPTPAPSSMTTPPQAAFPRPIQQAAPPRPAAQPKFRPPAATPRQAGIAQGSSAQQLAQERADIERFVQEEKEMEAGEPAALGVALTSPAAPASTPNSLFSGEGQVAGTGANSNLLRAIMLAQALGPPCMKAHRRRDSIV